MTNLSVLIDAYGQINAQLADLEMKKAEIRQALLELGPGAHEGSLFRVTISKAERATVDYKTICAKLEPSHQLVSAHTKVCEVSTVKVSGRNDANLKLAA